jgi:hypothetical protein
MAAFRRGWFLVISEKPGVKNRSQAKNGKNKEKNKNKKIGT